MSDLEQMKQAARTTWAAGDYDGMVDRILPAGVAVAEAIGAGPGDRVLDVAAGTGNAAIASASRGADVVASDLTPELFGPGRRRAEAAGVTIEWVEADAEALPFDDASFDAVTSTFGVMFAPRQSVAAAELARVVKPGGRLGLASWTPDGYIGHFFKTVAGVVGAPPPLEGPPPRWGSEDAVRELLGDAYDLTFEERHIAMQWPSFQDMVDDMAPKFGPLVMARQALEPQGRWQELLDAMQRLEEEWTSTPGEVDVQAAYLLVSGIRR